MLRLRKALNFSSVSNLRTRGCSEGGQGLPKVTQLVSDRQSAQTQSPCLKSKDNTLALPLFKLLSKT